MLDNDLLIGKPVVLAATAGTAPQDWADGALNNRIDRAAFELVLLMGSGFARLVREEAWRSYQHELGSAGGTELGIDTDLMRLAAGGSAS